MTDTLERGGAVPEVLEALRHALRKQLCGFVDDWSGLLAGNVAEARPLLNVVLAGERIGFRPVADGRYEVRVPIAFDRVLTAAVPQLARLQALGTSPAGMEPVVGQSSGIRAARVRAQARRRDARLVL